MKIVLALSLHVSKWGAERSMCAAMDALNHNGFHVVMIIDSHGDIEELLHKYNIDFFISPMDTFAIGYHPTFMNRFKRILLIIQHCLRDNSRIIKILSDRKIKPDYIYTNTLLPLNGIFLSRYYNAKHIIHIREFMEEDFNFRFILWDNIYLRILNRNVDRVICISNAICQKFKKYFGSKSVRIYNGIEIHPNVFLRRTLSENVLSLVFIGRLSQEKGIFKFIHVLSTLVSQGYKTFHLDIWGSGPLEQEISNFIREHQLQNFIRMNGYGNQVDMSIYDIGVMSSKCEGFGRTTVEYMLNSLPVIGYYSGATPEIIWDRETGFIYRNEDELLKILIYILKGHDKQKLKEMGMRGKLRAENFFSENIYLKNMVNIFSTLK